MNRFALFLCLGLTTATTCLAHSSSNLVVGEISEYKITWMGIPLAWARTSIDTITEEGRKLIRIRMESKNYKAYSHIYTVDDLTEVIIDPETSLPLRVDLGIHEGERVKSHLTTFYHDKEVAIFQDRITKDIKEVPITKKTMDIFSYIYANRSEDLESLAKQTQMLYADGKVYELGMTLHKEDTVNLPEYGKVECIQVEPIAEFDGMFVRKGKILFWVSKEKRRMVTCIKAKVPVGSITAKLQYVSGPGDDFWVRSND